MKKGRNQGMALGLAPAGELRQLRGRLLVCRGGSAVSPHGKPSTRGKISTKSKDKGKGSHKAKGLDVRLNPRLVSWRFIGPSGDPLWNRLNIQNYEDEEEEEEEEEKMEVMEERETEDITVAGDGGEAEQEEEGKEEEGEEKDGEDDAMGFYEVWGTWEYMDEEDWCVVGEEET